MPENSSKGLVGVASRKKRKNIAARRPPALTVGPDDGPFHRVEGPLGCDETIALR